MRCLVVIALHLASCFSIQDLFSSRTDCFVSQMWLGRWCRRDAFECLVLRLAVVDTREAASTGRGCMGSDGSYAGRDASPHFIFQKNAPTPEDPPPYSSLHSFGVCHIAPQLVHLFCPSA
ncbi:hypothetical protein, unlikely [Trypanosoma brucei gambiense DAL972]|uniref:T. brucei spp.-specific protein n=1 Tax=Trypanosoma brucei gambiense (strain MHOM/CI/86/DAL972) TaxID=679716 RepID=C9ZNF9_TRYB9|nr:hypothetical protein, unlikely [Trypanosoma brucei gambiense DAL972]CBH10937.1 hypothetical protein, unlikely [Trypanosoma brucei gambiense DAL972]|eukprot:XP_011773224.1 hypothetical protein, unlikely [Trypanosoma brucei gambiense DAL972]